MNCSTYFLIALIVPRDGTAPSELGTGLLTGQFGVGISSVEELSSKITLAYVKLA